MSDVGSRQVNWLTAHRFALPHLTQVGTWPMIGTPAWQALERFAPQKWAAILDAAQHWALRIQLNQEAVADAAHAISAATDWSKVAKEISEIRAAHAENPWMKRAAAQ